VGVFTGHECKSKGNTDRIGGTGILEANAIVRELVDMRGLDLGISMARESLSSQLVAQND
jgi:hypothetical protein